MMSQSSSTTSLSSLISKNDMKSLVENTIQEAKSVRKETMEMISDAYADAVLNNVEEMINDGSLDSYKNINATGSIDNSQIIKRDLENASSQEISTLQRSTESSKNNAPIAIPMEQPKTQTYSDDDTVAIKNIEHQSINSNEYNIVSTLSSRASVHDKKTHITTSEPKSQHAVIEPLKIRISDADIIETSNHMVTDEKRVSDNISYMINIGNLLDIDPSLETTSCFVRKELDLGLLFSPKADSQPIESITMDEEMEFEIWGGIPPPSGSRSPPPPPSPVYDDANENTNKLLQLFPKQEKKKPNLKMQQLEQEVMLLKETIQELQSEAAAHRISTQQREQLENEMAFLKNANETLEKEQNLLQIERDKLFLDSQTLEYDLGMMRTQMQTKEQEYNVKIQEISEEMKKMNATSEKQNNQFDMTASRLQLENEQLRNVLLEEQQENEKLRQQLEQSHGLKKEIFELQAALQQSKNTIQRLESLLREQDEPKLHSSVGSIESPPVLSQNSSNFFTLAQNENPTRSIEEHVIFDRLKEESRRLYDAQHRIDSANQKSSMSMEMAINELKLIRQARQEAEYRASKLENQVAKVESDIREFRSTASRQHQIPVEPEPELPSLRDLPSVEQKETSPQHVRFEPPTQHIKPPVSSTPDSQALDMQASPKTQPTKTPVNNAPVTQKPRIGERRTSLSVADLLHTPSVAEEEMWSKENPVKTSIKVVHQGAGPSTDFIRPQRVENSKKTLSVADLFPAETVKATTLKEEPVYVAPSVNAPTQVSILKSAEAPASSLLQSEIVQLQSALRKPTVAESRAPFATNATTRDWNQEFSLLERKLLLTNLEIDKYDAEYRRLVNRGIKTKKGMEEKSELEARIRGLKQEASSIRVVLRKQPK